MIRLGPLEELDQGGLEAWSDLAADALEPNPFFEPDFVVPSASAGETGIFVLRAEEAGRWIGCIPVQRRPLLPVVTGWRSPYVFLGTPLVRRGEADRFAAQLVGQLHRGFRRFLLLRRAGAGEVVDAILAAAAANRLTVVFERPEERAALRRREDGDYLAGMKSKRRSEMRRQRKKLDEALGPGASVRDRTDTAAIDDFLTLEAEGWKGRSGTALAADSQSSALFREVCSRFAADGRLSLRSLQSDERVAAMTCDLEAGHVRFGFKTSYDEELHRFSPGVQLQVENFNDFHTSGDGSLFDSCSEPDNEPMNALWPDQRKLTTLVLGPANPVGRLAGIIINTYADRRKSGHVKPGGRISDTGNGPKTGPDA